MVSGQRIGNFEISDPLGKGGMGEVWRATDKKLGRAETLDPVSVEIADVDVDEDPQSNILERKLVAKVRFEISGPQSSNLLEQQSSFLIEMWLIELEDTSRYQVAAIDSQFVPDTRAYIREASFEMPPPGRYELHTILLLRPPYEKLVSYAGPRINIVPEPFNLEAATA